jgi:hypothetical protein
VGTIIRTCLTLTSLTYFQILTFIDLLYLNLVVDSVDSVELSRRHVIEVPLCLSSLPGHLSGHLHFSMGNSLVK